MSQLLQGLRWQEVSVFGAYLLALLGLSLLSMRATKSSSDYWIAGGKLGWFRGGATLAATHASAGTFIGTVGVIYTVGWSFTWLVLSIPVAYWFNAVFLAPRFARQRELTAPAFLERRYESVALRRLGGLVVLVATVVYVQAQVVAGGLIAQVMFGLPPVVGMTLFTVVMILYTLAGGMVAVVLTDVLQLLVMTVGTLLAVPLALRAFAAGSGTGGFTGLVEAVQLVDPGAFAWGALPGTLLFSMALAFTLGSIATPEKLVRFYAMKDQRAIRRGILLAISVATGLNLLVFILALVAVAIFPTLPSGDLAMPLVARTVLPPLLGSLLLAAISAAMMSTVDSLLLVAGSAVAEDLLQSSRRSRDPRTALVASRLGVVGAGCAPLLLLLGGVGEGELVQFIVLLFSALMGACFFMPVVIGIYWRGANKYGAAAAMIGGLLTTFGWKLFGNANLDPVVPGFAISALLMVSVSLATRKTHHHEAFERYQDPGAPTP